VKKEWLSRLRGLGSRLNALSLGGGGAKLRLAGGRIVTVRPLNLKRALIVLGLIGEVLQRLGWDELSKKKLVQALFEAVAVGSEELTQALALLTGEPEEIVLGEFSPADAVRVVLAAYRQEFSKMPLKELVHVEGLAR